METFLGMRVPFIFGNVHMNEQLGEWGFWIDDCDIFDLSFYQEPHPYLRAKDASERTTENSKRNTTQGDTRENTRNEKTQSKTVFQHIG